MEIRQKIRALKKLKKTIVKTCEVCKMEYRVTAIPIFADREAREFDRIHLHQEGGYMSQRFSLNKQDLKQIAKNALIFLAPALLVFLTTFQATHNFEMASVALQTWGLNTAVDFLRKWSAGK